MSDRVAVVAPDGTPGTLPAEQLDGALAAGFTLPESPAAPAPAGAPAAAPVEDRVPVLAPDGTPGTLPRAQLQSALDAGFKLPGHDSAWDRLATGAEGLARGATLGISDLTKTTGAGLGAGIGNAWADMLGPDVQRAAAPGIDAEQVLTDHPMYDTVAAQESRAGTVERQFAHPELARGTEIAGAVGGALLSLGSGALAGAARLTPVGRISTIAAKVQSALLPRAAGAAGRIGALAAAGAAEGAMASAARRVVDDLAANDYDISAERMVSGLGGVIEDAIVGGASAGVVGGLVEGSRAAIDLGKAAIGRLAGKVAAKFDDGVSRITQAVEANAPKDLHFDLQLGPEGAIEAAGPLSTSQLPSPAEGLTNRIVAAAKGAAQDLDNLHEAAGSSIRDDWNAVLKIDDELAERAGLEAKRVRAAQILDEDPIARATAFEAAQTKLGQTRASLNALIDEAGEAALQDRGGLAALRHVNRAIDDAGARANKALFRGEMGDAYMALDDLKRVMGRAQRAGNPLAQPRLRAEYEELKAFLENDAIWPAQLAREQRRMNAAITEQIRRESDALIKPFFREAGEAAFDPFERLTQVRSPAIESLMKGQGHWTTEEIEQAVRRYLRSVAVSAKARAEVWGAASPELAEKAEDVVRRVSRIENLLNATGMAAKDAKAWKAVTESALGQVPTIRGVLKGSATIARGAMTPIQRLADSAAKQEHELQLAADSTIRNVLGPGTRKATLALPNATAAMRAVRTAQALQDPHSAESGRMRAAVNGFANDDPAFAAALGAKAAARSAFLASKAPAAPAQDPFAPSFEPPIDPVTQARLIRYADAASNPAGALTRISRGMGTAEDIETLRTVYPRLYAYYAARVAATVRAQKEPPTLEQRVALHRATGIAAGAMFTPEARAFYEQLSAQQLAPAQPQKGSQHAGKDVDERYGNRSDAILSGAGEAR